MFISFSMKSSSKSELFHSSSCERDHKFFTTSSSVDSVSDIIQYIMATFSNYSDSDSCSSSSSSGDEREFFDACQSYDESYSSDEASLKSDSPSPSPKKGKIPSWEKVTTPGPDAVAPVHNETSQLQVQSEVEGPGISDTNPVPPVIEPEGGKTYWPYPEPGEIPPGFEHPQKIKIHSIADVISPGDVISCVAPTVYHPSEFYLTTPKLWPGRVNAFAGKMSHWYTTLWYGPGRSEWVAAEENISLGSIVAVWREDECEWARGKIVRITQQMYKVFLIDFGLYRAFPKNQVYYLLSKFADQLGFVVKCRAQLTPFYDKFHKGHVDWDVDVKSAFFKSLKDKKVLVRFIKRDPDSVWVVSLESYAEPEFRHDLQIPIQKEVICQALGKYVEEDHEDEEVVKCAS